MSTMKTLIIRPADVSLNPIGADSNVADARVSVVYDRDVWVGGQPVPRVPLVETSIPAGGLRVPVLASDDPTITEGAGFVIKVVVETSPRIGQHNDAGTSLARTIQVVTADPAEIPLGSKSDLTIVSDPTQYADVMGAIKGIADAKAAAVRAEATADAAAAEAAASKTAATQAAASSATAQQSAASSAASAQAAQSALLTPSALPVSFPNLITDPTYKIFGSTGWSFLGGTAIQSGVNAVITGNGTISGIGLYTSPGQAFTGRAGHRYYVRAQMAIPDTSASNASLLSVSLSDNSTHVYVGGFQTAVANPVKGTKYTITGKVEIPAEWDGKPLRLYLRAYFADAASANSSQAFLYPAYVTDMTAVSPDMPEPTKEVLDRESAAQTPPDTALTMLSRNARTILDRTFATRTKRSVGAGPHVVLRFDDGFVNALEVAAPILARYGYPGTLYHCTGPANLGGITGDHPLMTPDQVRKLWDTYGWEIGAHTHAHEDAVDTAIDKWRTSAEASIANITGMGLPRPTSFAYPNGSRNAATDKLVYGLFDKVGLTGGPERAPWPYNKGTFFTGWCALGGANAADGKAALAKVKQYIRASFDQGNIPIVGMHGVTLAQPSLGHFVRADLLADLCQWLWAEGYPVSTQKDTPTHNMIADPGFMDQALTTSALGGHPWSTASVNGWKQYADPTALAGKCARLAATSGIGAGSQTYVEQRIAVHPGSSYKVYLHHCSPAYTSGAVVARVLWYDILGTQIGTDTPTAATINRAAPTGGEWVGGAPITAPAGACVARLQLLPDQAAGVTGDIRVDSVAMFPTTTYDPLA